MGLRQLLSKLASDNGIDLDDDELDSLGLDPDEVALDDELPGRAAGAAEIFLAAAPAEEKDGLIWSPIMYAGQWALRPDGKGGKKRIPLKIVEGSSRNQRREIGLKDVVSAFDDGAIENVTVPETHENLPTQNHGYISKLKIAKTKLNDKTVTALFGGFDIKLPETKRKMELGAVAGRSAGLLYDYERTDTGKKYPVALEHVTLTSRQWLRGMPRFGRKLAMLDEDIPVASLVLSDEGPTEEEYVQALAEVSEEDDFLADTAVAWSHEDDPKWLQQQVDQLLSQARAKKYEARRKQKSEGWVYIEDRIPSYRCTSAKPGSALIADGYGDGANYWVAGITIKDGEVILDEVEKWQATKQVWVPDEERETPKGDRAPLSDDVERDTHSAALSITKKSNVQLAQDARRARTGSDASINEPPRGGGNMAGTDTSALQLSDEARTAIQAAENRAKAAEQKAEQLSQTVDKLVGTANVNRTEAFIMKLKGMGLSEERGFSGMLKEIEQAMLADDGGPAVQADHFADNRNTSGELTLSETIERIFGALQTAEGTTLKLGEIITPPTEERTGEQNPGQDTGKPSKGDEEIDESKLSDDELLALQEKDHPGTLEAVGLKFSEANGSKGGES